MVRTLSKSGWQKKCDGLLTPIVISLHPYCLLCGRPTEVAHHHVHKSKSSRLRYELDNLINLCNSCHYALHQNESYYASKIVKIKGLKWFARLEKLKNEIVRTSIAYYQSVYEKLSNITN